MKLVINQVASKEDMAAMFRIRQEVFERERGIVLTQLQVFDQTNALHLLVREEHSGKPAAALTVVETSGDYRLHETYGLNFDPQVRTARYTQLAVLEQYRGMDIPLWLVFESLQRFVVPGKFGYSWLLFDAERSLVSSFFRRLAFTPSLQTFQSEYGLCRSLVRDESSLHVRRNIPKVRRYFEQNCGVFQSCSI